MRRDPIVIVPYDPAWPELFAREAARVTGALRPWLVGDVEHIGSTAVPGLPAKPIVDMLARVRAFEPAAEARAALAGIGWVAAPEPGDADRRKYSYCFPSVEHRTHHLHVVERFSPDWPTWIIFRDRLRQDPEATAAYARIKQELAAADAEDRPRYRAGKAPFIRSVIDQSTKD
ncbi:GrpB family protein [Hamadaea tsunoensis]|uniref:GrpB family protein n=1 Tax=Hamadaea tsunoensis TaxID=53368 RepID=UPI000413E994|nr:GrpB family protein [Hamadaea tsunoensis]